MTENENPNVQPPAGEEIPQAETPKQETHTAADSWQEVGYQFQVMGQSLAQAMRAAWQNEETQRQLHEMRTGLESMVQEVGKAIQESANTVQGQKIKEDATKAAESFKTATVQTAQEVRPQIVTALKTLNEELSRLVERMEKKE